MQALRSDADKQGNVYGRICNMVMRLTIGNGTADDTFSNIMELVAQYGSGTRKAGYWDGAIAEMLGVCETPSEREAREYAENAAKSGQIEFLMPCDPDDPRSTIERSGTG